MKTTVAILTDDQLILKYSLLVNRTRTEQMEIEFQVIKYELEKRAAL